jgi:uncharacterized protein (DUF305 family)
MDTKVLTVALIGLVVGAGGTFLVTRDSDEMPGNGSHMMADGEMMDDDSMGMHGAMKGMMASLNGKTGDAFDKAFLSEMIIHHQGAVQMAEAAKVNAKHPEIKAMADAIISAQTSEIRQMQDWQRSWYGAE